MGVIMSCCKGKKSGQMAQKVPRGVEGNEPQAGEIASQRELGPNFPSVQFDVVVPDRYERSPGPSRGGFMEQSVSFGAFDQTMYTMRDLGQSFDGSNTFALDNNMSITNNYTEVNDDVVNKFMKTIANLGEAGNVTKNMLEESMSLSRFPPSGEGGVASSVSLRRGTGAGVMAAEDNEYIADGATLAERLSRLEEVEEVLRQNIYGSWKMNALLVQLAAARVVPTLRQRRKPWSKPHSTHSPESAAAAAPKRPVLIIHAPDVEFESSVISAPHVQSSGEPSDAVFSPASVGAAPAPVRGGDDATPMEASTASCSRLVGEKKKVEHYELVALACKTITDKTKVTPMVINETWDFLSNERAAAHLNGGGCLFRFMCSSTAQMDEESLDTINTFINISSFADETRENNTPRVDILDPEEASKYIAILVKAMYMLPNVKISDITPELLSSLEYQKACQPGNPKLEGTDCSDTFRLSLNIIKFVFSMTIQFKVSEVKDAAILFACKNADGIVPAKVLMLERTKRNIAKVDATAKVRSMLLYYPVNGGVLVNNQTVVLNTSIPKVVSKIVNTFGSQGTAQSVDTAKLTREYMWKRFHVNRGR